MEHFSGSAARWRWRALRSNGYHVLRRMGSGSNLCDQHRFPNAERALYLPAQIGKSRTNAKVQTTTGEILSTPTMHGRLFVLCPPWNAPLVVTTWTGPTRALWQV